MNEWCDRWGLSVNATKTKVMQFRPKGRKQCNLQFMCGSSIISMTDKYKYLGLWFTSNLDFSYMAEQVAVSAHRALGLLIAKAKSIGGLPHACFKRLYDTMVQSIIDYGASVWGHKEFSCVKAVQHRAVRFFLGVRKTTCNAAIMGEVGWIPQIIHQKLCIVRQWFRYGKMQESRLNKKIIRWALNSKKCNLLNSCKELFHEFEFDAKFSLDDQYGKADVKYFRDAMLKKFEETWLDVINNPLSVSGVGMNKLRTYKWLKLHYESENYVCNKSIRYCDRRAMAQLRCGSAAIGIETGRYKNGVYLPAHERICLFCKENPPIEDEVHVLIQCSLYDDLRDEMLEHAASIEPSFPTFSDLEKFVFLMSNDNLVKYTAKTCRQILNRRKDFIMV